MTSPVVTTPAGTTDEVLDSVFKGLQPTGEKNQAPAVIGKAVYEDDLRAVASIGIKGYANLFGHKVGDKADLQALPINFGSKMATQGLPKEIRLRLFNLKKAVHNVEVQAQVMYRGMAVTPAMIMEVPAFKDHLAPLLKAYNITDFSNWIPQVNARFYFEEYEIPFVLADQFDQMPMDSASVEVPGDIGHLEGFEETDSATFTAQATTQSGYLVTSRNNVVHAQITQDLLSDSAPQYIEKLRRDVVMGIARAYEKCIINGDITGSPRGASHQDTDTQALALNATFQKAFNGIRKISLAADTAVGAGSFVYDHGGDSASKVMFEKVLKLAGKFGSEKDDLVWVLPSSVENALVTGAIPELFTAFAFGGIASNVTGQVPPVFGIRCVTSQYVREDLNSSAVYASGQTLTHVSLVKKSRFANFVRQAVRVWASPSLPSSDIMLMTAKMRHAWAGNPQSATEKSCVMAKNVATT